MIKRLIFSLSGVLALFLLSGWGLAYVYYTRQDTFVLHVYRDDACGYILSHVLLDCNHCYTVDDKSLYFNCFTNAMSVYNGPYCANYTFGLPRNTCTTRLRWQ